MFTDIETTHYLLTFGSSCVTLALGFLLLGIRIPKQDVLTKLRSARVYLSGAYFVLAASGFFSYFMHVEAENNAVLMASTLFIASAQAFLFTTTCITFIRPAYIRRRFVVINLLVIAFIGIPLVVVSILANAAAFRTMFYCCIALYIAQLLRYVYLFRREYGRGLKELEDYYDEDENYRMRWVKVCFYSALGIGVWALASIFSGGTLYCLFIVAYTIYYACVVHRFYNYVTDTGFLIPVLSAKPTRGGDDIPKEELAEDDIKHLSEKERRLKAALDKWVADREYCRGEIGTENVVASLGTNRNFFDRYFRTHIGANFRTWRIELRVAEAKRIMAERPDISLDEVCRLAGFNHPSNLHRQFEKIVGETPFSYKNRLNGRS